MKQRITKVLGSKRTNSSYGNYATLVEVNGSTTRFIHSFTKANADTIKAGQVIPNGRD